MSSTINARHTQQRLAHAVVILLVAALGFSLGATTHFAFMKSAARPYTGVPDVSLLAKHLSSEHEPEVVTPLNKRNLPAVFSKPLWDLLTESDPWRNEPSVYGSIDAEIGFWHRDYTEAPRSLPMYVISHGVGHYHAAVGWVDYSGEVRPVYEVDTYLTD